MEHRDTPNTTANIRSVSSTRIYRFLCVVSHHHNQSLNDEIPDFHHLTLFYFIFYEERTIVTWLLSVAALRKQYTSK